MSNSVILPPAKIGILGGGQLGRMLALVAKRMGYHITILDPNPNCCASQVVDKHIVGSLYDNDKINELAMSTDVMTYEFEFIDADILCDLQAKGYKIYPSGATLKNIQNKYVQKSLFKEANLPVPKFKSVESKEDIISASEEFGFPFVLKYCTGGYDGKGNFIIKNETSLKEALEEISFEKSPLMVEEFIPFVKELSIAAAISSDRNIKLYPIVENHHEDSILIWTKAPALVNADVEIKIKEIANGILNLFNDTGLFCVELFLTADGNVYINEVAPRPHNSAHYTIEGCLTSQFEQQLRAITGLPLGSTELTSPSVMLNLLGKDKFDENFTIEGLDEILLEDKVYFHFYGKNYIDIKKKIGHLTTLDTTVDKAYEKAINAMNKINITNKKEA
ncbi:MAG: 5-(carboxyamino)imidazole ribonucleotide synthase [Clostridium sp.]